MEALPPPAGVQRYDASRPTLELDADKARAIELQLQLLRRRKPAHRYGEVRIRGGISRNHATQKRENASEVKAIHCTERPSRRLGEFQDSCSSAGLQHSQDFLQSAFVVRKIAETEGARNKIEAGVSEWEV
jgi:hypothetical protein